MSVEFDRGSLGKFDSRTLNRETLDRWTGRIAFLTPNLPTGIIPIKIARLKLSGKSPMDMSIPPLRFKIMLESNPLKSRILVRKSAVPLTSPYRKGGATLFNHIATSRRPW